MLLLPLVAWECTKPVPESPVDPPVVDTIKYYEQCLFRPGDYGSTNWRIPAICCLPDGSLLIVCDRRKYNEKDLPEDIDIVSRRSTDNGRTWSEPVTIAQGTGRKHGFGDAALVVCENGDVVCVFVGGNGLFASSESDPSAAMCAAAPTVGRPGLHPRTSPHSFGEARPLIRSAATTAPRSSARATASG